MPKSDRELELEQHIAKLELKIQQYQKQLFKTESPTVKTFDDIAPLFEAAEKTVGDYFSRMVVDPAKASIEIAGQRYILLRASSLSVDFFNTIRQLYADKGEDEAFSIGQNFLFDIAHVIGLKDAKNFHEKMGLVDPLSKLSAGPVHFAYSGWAFVDLMDDSVPSPDENFYIHYQHPYSFEADSWIQAGVQSKTPVCIMNSGYSSGWCEESFGISLTAVELSCRACGDERCTFIMAPPHKIEGHLQQYETNSGHVNNKSYTIPSFFIRKEVEEQIRLAKEKAEASDLAKSDFLANMSHEIRTPLHAIMGYADLLQADNLPEKYSSFINNIRDNSQHLLNLVNGILDLSKIEAGQLLLNPEPCNFIELLHKSNDIAKTLLSKQKEIDIKLSIPSNVNKFIITDGTKLQQILYNLLSNAIKFTAEGQISWGVTLDAKSNQLHFFVTDTGIGIDDEMLEIVFDKFKQADSSISRKFGGTGLGLTITKRLVELLGGQIEVHSQIDKGTSFNFNLPYQPYHSKLHDDENNKPLNSSNKSTFNILLVDDNEINLKLTAFILKKHGYTVSIARNGEEALNSYFENQDKIDLILMDIQMPVMDGLEATLLIREKAADDPIPIIALSAHAMKGDMERCLEAGCNAYLTKPIGPDELIKKIQQMLIKK